MSAESERVWAVTSVEVEISVAWASRALATIDLAVVLPAVVRLRSISAARLRTWLEASVEAFDQRGLDVAGAGQDRVGGGGAGGDQRALDVGGEGRTCCEASVDAVTSVDLRGAGAGQHRVGRGGAGRGERALDVGGQRLDLLRDLGRGRDQRGLRGRAPVTMDPQWRRRRR